MSKVTVTAAQRRRTLRLHAEGMSRTAIMEATGLGGSVIKRIISEEEEHPFVADVTEEMMGVEVPIDELIDTATRAAIITGTAIIEVRTVNTADTQRPRVSPTGVTIPEDVRFTRLPYMGPDAPQQNLLELTRIQSGRMEHVLKNREITRAKQRAWRENKKNNVSWKRCATLDCNERIVTQDGAKEDTLCLTCRQVPR